MSQFECKEMYVEMDRMNLNREANRIYLHDNNSIIIP